MASLADDLCAEVRRQCEQAEWYKRLWIQAQDDLSKKDDLIATLRAQLNLSSGRLNGDSAMGLKHTPGPWHVEWAMAQGGDAHHVCDRRSMAELSVIATTHFHDDTDGETEANARLIAASPEMLEALLLWQEFFRKPPSFAASDAFGKAKAATNAAIAAATGE